MIEQKKNMRKRANASHKQIVNAAAALLSVAVLHVLGTFPADAMTFTVSRSGAAEPYILAQGDIDEGDDETLAALLRAVPRTMNLILSSQGGNVMAAVRIGEVARAARLTTMVAPRASCLSACLLAFIGGTERRVPEGSDLGSHQFRLAPEAGRTDSEQTAQGLSARILQHFLTMGVDPEALTHILETPPEDMFVFSDLALTKYKLITAPAIPRQIVVDRCTGKVVAPGTEPEECSDTQRWVHITVPDFLKSYPQYQKGTDAYRRLDAEVRKIQSDAPNPFDPAILVEAHKRVSSTER